MSIRPRACVKCGRRFLDGLRICPECKFPTQLIVVCTRCGREFNTKKHRDLHWRTCQKLPRPKELADLFDADPLMSTPKAARRYKVGVNTIVRHLEGTRWHRQRLASRGFHASGHRRRLQHASGHTTPCTRCLLVGQPLDPAGLCSLCIGDIQRIIRRLRRAVSLRRSGQGLGIRYPLNHYDTQYLLAQTV